MAPYGTFSTPTFTTAIESSDGIPLIVRMADPPHRDIIVVRALGKKCGGTHYCIRQQGHNGMCWKCDPDLYRKTPGVWVAMATAADLRDDI